MRGPKKRIHLNAAEVKRLYIDKKWTIPKLASHFGIDGMSVHRFMVEANIPRRGKGRTSQGDTRTITRRRLKELYIDKHLSQPQIARIFLVSPTTIFNKLRYFRIPMRQPPTRHLKLDGLEIGESYSVPLENH